MLANKKRFYLFFFLMLTLCLYCSKGKQKEKQKPSEEEEYSITSNVEGQLYDVNINYDSLLTVIGQLTEMVSSYPNDFELRKNLVSTCYDTLSDIILASGRGRPLISARTPTLAMKYAEKAATIDAYRWAAYIKKWHLNPTTPDIGKLSVEVSAGQVVSKKVLPDSTVQVLVAVRTAN